MIKTVRASKSMTRDGQDFSNLLKDFITSPATEQKFRYKQRVYKFVKNNNGSISLNNSKGVTIMESSSPWGFIAGHNVFNLMKASRKAKATAPAVQSIP